MSEPEMKAAIDEHMPLIDKQLNELQIPIFKRFFQAACIFIEVAVIDSSFDTKDDLLKSDAFIEGIVPLVNDWYFNKYGKLATTPKDNYYSGIINPFGQPTLIKIPSTIRKVEIPNKTAWFAWPDSLQETELLADMVQVQFEPNNLSSDEANCLSNEFNEVVSLTRSINLNLMSVKYIDVETNNLAQGIWSHFEKAIVDILSFENQKASIGCWELHLAIEKSLKVYLRQRDGGKHFGHDLLALRTKVNNCVPDIDLSLIDSLPSGKDAIKLRYSELIRSTCDAAIYYKNALNLVFSITGLLQRNYIFNNASFLIKVAPWAK